MVRYRRRAEAGAALHRRHLVPDYADHGPRQGRPHRADRNLGDARRQSLAGAVDRGDPRLDAEHRGRDAPDAGGFVDLSGDRRNRRRD